MSLVPTVTLGSLELTSHPYAVEFGAMYGNPENAYEVLSSLLADGEIIGSSRTANREISLPILIEGADLAEIADNEQALVLECEKSRNILTVDPGDGYGATTVFETFRAQVVHNRNDDEEMANLRRYTLTIQALPYPRSVDKVSDDAQAADWSSGTVYDDGTSTTNWSGWLQYRTPAKAVDSGAVRIEYGAKTLRSAVSDGEGITEWENRDTRSGLSIMTGTGGYLSIVVKLEKSFSEDIALNYGGIARSRVESITMTTSTGATLTASFSDVEQIVGGDGKVRYAWPMDAGLTITAITIQSLQYAYTYTSPSNPHVWYDDLIFSTATTTANQYAKVVDVAGSVRSPGSIQVSSSVALGSVLLCTVPDDEIAVGFTPDVAKWKTAGASRTADTGVIGGGYFPAGTPFTFEVPVSMLTEGAYTVVMLNRSGPNPMSTSITASLRIGGTQVGDSQTISNAEAEDVGGTFYRFFTVGELYLPVVPLQQPDSTAKVRLVVNTGSNSFAEFWLIPTWGDLTLVNCGTGTVSASGASSHFWADSPSPERPMGAWWRGASSDRSLAVSAVSDLFQPGRHLLYPTRTRVFVAASHAAGPAVTVDYWPHFHGWATQ